MSKKHVIALAARLKSERPIPTGHPMHDNAAAMMWWTCTHAIADVCATYNSAFDRARFLTACGADVVLPSHRAAMERAS